MAASSPRVAVVDYGAGNLRSVSKALERSGFTPRVTGAPGDLRQADCLVLPGVGAFADAARRLEETAIAPMLASLLGFARLRLAARACGACRCARAFGALASPTSA